MWGLLLRPGGEVEAADLRIIGRGIGQELRVEIEGRGALAKT